MQHGTRGPIVAVSSVRHRSVEWTLIVKLFASKWRLLNWSKTQNRLFQNNVVTWRPRDSDLIERATDDKQVLLTYLRNICVSPRSLNSFSITNGLCRPLLLLIGRIAIKMPLIADVFIDMIILPFKSNSREQFTCGFILRRNGYCRVVECGLQSWSFSLDWFLLSIQPFILQGLICVLSAEC